MKKLIVGLLMVFFCGSVMAQNNYKYPINAKGGIVFGLKSLAANKLDSAIIRGDSIIFYQGATQIKAGSGGGGGSTDTTHLSDRINLKLNSADSSSTLGKKYSTGKMLNDGLGLKINIVDSSSTATSHYATGWMLANGLGAKVDTTGQVEITDVAIMLADQKSTLAFGVGSGDATDTLSLSTTRKYGSLYWGGNLTFHADTMVVSLMAGAGLDTIAVQINWSDTLNAVIPTVINTTALAVGRISGTNVARTIGQFDNSFNNATIPPGKHVWLSLPYVPAASLKRKPTMVSVTLIGHLQ